RIWSVTASMTTAFTVVEPTSMPMKNCLSIVVEPTRAIRRLRFLTVAAQLRLVDRHLRFDVVDEVRGQTDHALGVRHIVKRPLAFRVSFHPGAALVERQAGIFQ